LVCHAFSLTLALSRWEQRYLKAREIYAVLRA
jgi:hypothetical protein